MNQAIEDTFDRLRKDIAEAGGMNPMDGEVLLADAMYAAEKMGVTMYAGFGTALGVVRDGQLIEWDEDVDVLAMMPFDMNAFAAHMVASRHQVVRQSSAVWSFAFGLAYLDVYLFSDGKDVWRCCGHSVRDEWLVNAEPVMWHGLNLTIPQHVPYFEHLYGSTWKQRIRGKNATT